MKKNSQHIIYNDKPVISIQSLYKSFGELDVLKNVSLTLNAGENVVVLGKSGTGKSVLIKIIAGLLKPDAGSVVVLGEEVNKLNEKELNALRLHIGFSFQNSALYDSMNIYENLEFPLKMNKQHLTNAEVHFAVEEALDAVCLKNKMNVMPSDLSGGQKKRIGIARTLILKPQIMLYDEPTAGLDPVTSAEINSLILDVQEQYNTSSIIITHDLTCARTTGNRIAVLINGTFLKTGTFEDVFDTEDETLKSFYDYNFITAHE